MPATERMTVSDERDKRDGDTEIEDSDADVIDAESSDADSTDEGEAAASRPSGKRSARRSRAGADAGSTKVATRPTRSQAAAAASKQKQENVFKRLRRFFREVIAELRKVIWPNRKQMITYTSVVLVFVIFMVAFISGLDIAFIKGVSWLFG
jgi:preprotein translocase subunit SecE